MSISFSWQMVKGTYLSCNAPSTFYEIFLSAFGNMPYELSQSDYETLRGISIADKSNTEAWNELIDAIEKHERIRVYIN